VKLAVYDHGRLDVLKFFNNFFDRSMSKMKMKKGLLMTALITGTVMSSAVAFAEELQEYSLDQMVVTATRTEKKDLDIPAVVEVYSEKAVLPMLMMYCKIH